MENTVGTWLGIIGGLCGLIVLIAGLLVSARGSYNKAKIAALREDLDDSRKREQDRQTEVDDLRSKLDVCDAKIDGLIRENVVLKDLVTQRVEIGGLQALIETLSTTIVGLRADLSSAIAAQHTDLVQILHDELAAHTAALQELLVTNEEGEDE